MDNEFFVQNWKGSDITFRKKDDIMINATEMAKPFDKKPADWLRTGPTKDYIQALTNSHICALADLVKIKKGGTHAGTWIHRKLALVFARWLSAEFAVWCDERIEELLKHGVTALPSTIDKIIKNPQFLIKLLTELEDERKVKAIAEGKLKQLIPAMAFLDKIVIDDSEYDIGMTAKILNIKGSNNKVIGRNILFAKLRGNNIFFQNRNEPYQQYVSNGCFNTYPIIIEGTSKTTGLPFKKAHLKVMVTHKGMLLINNLFGGDPGQLKMPLVT